MTNLLSYPLQDNFETTLAQEWNGTVGTVYLNSTPDFTFPSWVTTYIVANPKQSNMQVAKIDSYDPVANTCHVSSITVYSAAGVLYTAQVHPSGSIIRISDNYQFWEDIATAIATKADTNSPAFTGSFKVPVYQNAAARNVAIPSPLNGMECYLTDEGYFTDYTSWAWVSRAAWATPNASTTVAGKVQQGTAADNIAHTEIGTTGAPLFMSPKNTVTTSAGAADEGKALLLDSTGGISSTVINNTTLPIQTVLPTTTATGWAEEAITTNDAVSVMTGRLQYVTTNNMNTTAWGTGWSWPTWPTAFKTWFAFTVKVWETGTISSIDAFLRSTVSTGTYWSDNTVAITGAYKIYAVTGTPWVDALPTGSALYTSTTVWYTFVQADYSVGVALKALPQATFTAVTLAAGNYVIQYEGTVSGGGFSNGATGTACFAGTTSWSMFQVNGVQGWVTASTTNIMYFYLNLPDNYVYKARADILERSAFAGFANSTVSVGAAITYQTQGSKTITCTTNVPYYLSDTPWAISATVWTYPVLIAYGLYTNTLLIGVPYNKVSMSVTNNTVAYAGCNWFISWFTDFSAGGWVVWTVRIYTGTLYNVVSTQVAANMYSSTSWSISAIAPVQKWQFYKIVAAVTWGGSLTNTLIKFVPDYL